MNEVPNPDPHTRLCAYALCVDGDRVLLTQLWSRDSEPGSWTLPGGGVQFGERPLDALARELHEETGLTGTVRGVLEVDSVVFAPWNGWGPLHHVRIIYEVEATGDPTVMEVGGSTVAAAWVPIDEIASLPLTSLAHRGAALARARVS